MKGHQGCFVVVWIVIVLWSAMLFFTWVPGDEYGLFMMLAPLGIMVLITAFVYAPDPKPEPVDKRTVLFVVGHYLGQLISRLLR